MTREVFDAPVLLTEAHDGSSFNSGEPSLDDWLRQRAWNNLQLAASRTYVVCPAGTRQIIGYYALSMGQILAQDAAGRRAEICPNPFRRCCSGGLPSTTHGRAGV